MMISDRKKVHQNYRKFSCGLTSWDVLEGATVEKVTGKGIHVCVCLPDNPSVVLQGFCHFNAALGSILSLSIVTEFQNVRSDGSIQTSYLFRVESVDENMSVSFIA